MDLAVRVHLKWIRKFDEVRFDSLISLKLNIFILLKSLSEEDEVVKCFSSCFLPRGLIK